jgi:uncharacterized membrane protein
VTPLTAEELLAPAELERVRAAIRAAEARTSGEIRVHLDDTITDDVLDHAAFVFEELAMHRTKDRNGALIYISVAQHRAAVIGDAGIHAKLPKGFWNETLGVILEQFKAERFCEGLCMGVERLGQQMHAHFPREANDRNELSDDISFGK